MYGCPSVYAKRNWYKIYERNDSENKGRSLCPTKNKKKRGGRRQKKKMSKDGLSVVPYVLEIFHQLIAGTCFYTVGFMAVTVALANRETKYGSMNTLDAHVSGDPQQRSFYLPLSGLFFFFFQSLREAFSFFPPLISTNSEYHSSCPAVLFYLLITILFFAPVLTSLQKQKSIKPLFITDTLLFFLFFFIYFFKRT